MKPITDAYLTKNFLGRNINVICRNGYADPALNHCAHFVCHVLRLSKPEYYSCWSATHGPDSPGALVRVHNVFSLCQTVGDWSTSLGGLTPPYLVFVTTASGVNLATKHMPNVPNKHVGIYVGGKVYNYHNAEDKVGTRTPDQFCNLYSGTNYAYYGTLEAHRWFL